jgi:peptidoglycan/LPS O-acetylase OafA/YrhL
MGDRNETVDALRAVAALAVCLFHFTPAAGLTEASLLRPFAFYGQLGVEVFFVISGFIIPYSLARSGYTIAALPGFLARRLIRLEPPYLASIAIALALAHAVSVLRDAPVNWSWAQLVAHPLYLNGFAGLPWLNAAYWTLAIELQFYVLIGLLLPRILGASTLALAAGLAVCLLLAVLVPSDPLDAPRTTVTILPHLPVFAVGVVTFAMLSGRLSKPAYSSMLAAVGTGLLFTRDLGVMLATVLPAIAIATVRMPRNAALAWLGATSYSIYLLHFPIGARVVNLASSLGGSAGLELLAVAAGLAATIMAAWALYVLLEQP